MKQITIALVLISAQAFANRGTLHYATGPLRGTNALTDSSLVGYEELCFRGDLTTAASDLYRLLNKDSEKKAVFVRTSGETLVYGYTASKCLDEGEIPANCRVVETARRCR
jgi:hypothetical protein